MTNRVEEEEKYHTQNPTSMISEKKKNVFFKSANNSEILINIGIIFLKFFLVIFRYGFAGRREHNVGHARLLYVKFFFFLI